MRASYHGRQWAVLLKPEQRRLQRLMDQCPHRFQDPSTMPIVSVSELHSSVKACESLSQGAEAVKDWICVQFWHIRRFLKLSAAERLYELDLETQGTPEAATSLGSARLAIEKQLKLKTAMALSELMFMGNSAIRDILQPLLEARSVMRAARVPVARTRVEEAEFATICTAPSLLTVPGMPVHLALATAPSLPCPRGDPSSSHADGRSRSRSSGGERVSDTQGDPPAAQRRMLSKTGR